MKAKWLVPPAAFGLVLTVHALWFAHVHDPGPWASFTPDGGSGGVPSYLDESIWLGLSYAAGAAFGAWCLLRLHGNHRRALPGACGGLALTGILYATGCFLLGCCGSPMLAVYLGVFGPRFLGITGPLTLLITLGSITVGYLWVTARASIR